MESMVGYDIGCLFNGLPIQQNSDNFILSHIAFELNQCYTLIKQTKVNLFS